MFRWEEAASWILGQLLLYSCLHFRVSLRPPFQATEPSWTTIGDHFLNRFLWPSSSLHNKLLEWRPLENIEHILEEKKTYFVIIVRLDFCRLSPSHRKNSSTLLSIIPINKSTQ
jgi:hypothetical protein